MEFESSLLLRRLALYAALGLVGWGFYNQTVRPRAERRAAAEERIRELRQELAVAEQKEVHIRSLEEAASHARMKIDQILAERPVGSPMFWFPKKIASHFERFGIHDAATRLTSERDEPELINFSRSFWTVQLPVRAGKDGDRDALGALAEIELSESLVQVLDVSVRPDPNEATGRILVANITALTQK